jgi:hypothetical protein
VYLGWRRVFFGWWAVTAAAVAFLAAVAAVPPFYREIFGSDASAEFTFDGQALDGLNVRVTNTGRKAISVNLGTITVTTREGQAIGELATEKKYFHTRSILIESGQAQIIKFYLVGYRGWVWPSPDGNCELRFDYLGYGGREGSSHQQIDCSDIQDFGLMWGAWVSANGRRPTGNLGIGESTTPGSR